MKFILGKKLVMSQIFKDSGEVIPVTVVKAGPCQVTQVKTVEKDGYRSVQIGFAEKKKLNKSILGHLKGLANFRHLREFRLDMDQEVAKGQLINASCFKQGDTVTVTGVSKGKGFQGVVKRHGFAGSPKSHGHKDQLRMPGSIGVAGTGEVFKGMRMAGRMGHNQVTVTNLEVVKVEPDKNLLYIKGAMPGVKNSLLLIRATGELPVVDELKIQPDKNFQKSVDGSESVDQDKPKVEPDTATQENQIQPESGDRAKLQKNSELAVKKTAQVGVDSNRNEAKQSVDEKIKKG